MTGRSSQLDLEDLPFFGIGTVHFMDSFGFMREVCQHVKDVARRKVSLGSVRMPPLCIPGEIFTVYQSELGPLPTLLWLNFRWSVHAGSTVDPAERAKEALGVDEVEVARGIDRLKEFGLLAEDSEGNWIVHDPLPEEVFRLRYSATAVSHDTAPAEPSVQTGYQHSSDDSHDSSGPAMLSAAPNGRAPQRSEEPQEDPPRVLRSPLSKRRSQARMLKLVDEHSDVSQPVSEDMQAVFQIYHKRIGMLGPTQYEKLRFWVEEQGMEGAVVALAIEETVRSAEVPRIAYLEGILRNWYNDGIRTLADVGERHLASKVFAQSEGKTQRTEHEGLPNASAYQSVSPELVSKWKELYPDEYDR